MTISIDDCYRAFEARDPAYDGRFYVGVVTTGVYCRPVCAGRPKRENVRFYATAGEARDAGFRACKRCKPEA
jgi:methylphosphotriester-DNA--protein-cysteine methyltransferase